MTFLNYSTLIKTERDIKEITVGARILSSMMLIIKEVLIKYGLQYSPVKLEELVQSLMKIYHVTPCFVDVVMNGVNYPTALCVSVNNEVAHTPALSTRLFRLHDVVKVDFGIWYKRWCTDMAFTILIGGPDPLGSDARLVEGTYIALQKSIQKCLVGSTLKDISLEIQRVLLEYNLGIPVSCSGHFIGRELHEKPYIPNYGKDPYEHNIILKAGMVFCIEPIATLGHPDLKLGSDGFTLLTKDGSNNAHFEHMILVTETSPIILTSMANSDTLLKGNYV